MKVLLLYTNKNRFLAPPPMGLAMIADSVAGSHEVELIDFMWEKQPEAKAIRAIRDFRPDVIGLSLRILDDQDGRDTRSPIAEIKPFISDVRRVSRSPIVLGGTAFTTFPTEMLEYLAADYGIAGQGESVFPSLVENIGRSVLDENLPGLVFRKNGRVIANPPVIEGYPTAFTPARSYYDPRPYRRTWWPGIVLIKTGCPLRCAYCDTYVTAGRQFKLRTPEIIVSELEYQIKTLDTRIFHLADPCFNTTLDHAKSVLEAIIRSGLKMVAMTTLRPDNFDDELFVLMKRAGIMFVSLGADTLSQAMLDNYRKGFTIEQVERCCRALQKHGIGYMLECVFGGPGETKQTVEESFAFLNQVKPTLTLLYAGLRILPETDLYQIAVAEGIVRDRSELLFPRYYFSRDTGADWLHRRIDAYNRRYGYRNIGMGLLLIRRRMRLWLK
ncbi:MAG: radical SAM protein [Chloroflexota bacterium]